MGHGGNSGGIMGFFKTIWHFIQLAFIGIWWQTKEMWSKKRKLDLESVSYKRGDVVVITGGGRGIGMEVIKILLKCDMHVIMGCRKVSDGENAIKSMRSDGISTGIVEILPLDLMSLSSVRAFGNEIIEKNLPVSILINNAGIMFPNYQKSEDGCESQFQVNYLSHFILTDLLLPTLISSGSPGKVSRIINVSSCAHYGGKIDFNDLQMEKFYSPKLGYMNSKLMQVISSMDLNSRLINAEVNVRAYSLHPGVVQTDLYRNSFVGKLSFLTYLFFLSPEQGAQTVAYAALSPELENDGGIFLANCQKFSPNPQVYDASLQEQLFKSTTDLLKSPDLNINSLSKNPFNPTQKVLPITNPVLVDLDC